MYVYYVEIFIIASATVIVRAGGVLLLYCCVALLMDLFVLCVWLAVFVNCLVKQFAISLGVVFLC